MLSSSQFGIFIPAVFRASRSRAKAPFIFSNGFTIKWDVNYAPRVFFPLSRFLSLLSEALFLLFFETRLVVDLNDIMGGKIFVIFVRKNASIAFCSKENLLTFIYSKK